MKLTLAHGARTQPFSSQACPSSYPPLRSHRGEEAETKPMQDDEEDEEEATQVGRAPAG